MSVMSHVQMLKGFLSIVLLASTVTTGTADASNAIQFSLMVSSAPGLNTSSAQTAVDEVLKVINNDSNILQGYWLKRGDPMQLLSTKVIT